MRTIGANLKPKLTRSGFYESLRSDQDFFMVKISCGKPLALLRYGCLNFFAVKYLTNMDFDALFNRPNF